MENEYETSLSVKIDECMFDNLISEFPPIKKQYVEYFVNERMKTNEDGRKIRVQQKKTVFKNNIIKIFIPKNADKIINKNNYYDFDDENEDSYESFTTMLLKKPPLAYKKFNYQQQIDQRIKLSYFIPLTRKYSTETNCDISPDCILNLDDYSLVIRYILFKIKTDNYKLRIALEKQSLKNEHAKYVFTAEIEYNKNVYNTYAELLHVESILLQFLYDKFEKCLLYYQGTQIFRITECEQYSISSRKFSYFSKHFGVPMHEIVPMIKWNGVKARIIHKGNGDFTYIDDENITMAIKIPIFNKLPKVVLQIEVMHENNEKFRHIIITDVLNVWLIQYPKLGEPSSSHNSTYTAFTPEPLESLNFLKFLNFNNLPKQLRQVYDKKGDVLFYLRNQMPVQTTINYINEKIVETGRIRLEDDPNILENLDGFILILDNHCFKYKIPTLDVCYRDRKLILDFEPNNESTKSLTLVDFRKNPEIVDNCFSLDIDNCTNIEDILEENGIYEIRPNKNNIRINRKRNDRFYSSNEQEYKNYESELNFFRSLLQKNTTIIEK